MDERGPQNVVANAIPSVERPVVVGFKALAYLIPRHLAYVRYSGHHAHTIVRFIGNANQLTLVRRELPKALFAFYPFTDLANEGI